MHYFKYCLSVHLGFLFVLVSALTSQELCVCVCALCVCGVCVFRELLPSLFSFYSPGNFL